MKRSSRLVLGTAVIAALAIAGPATAGAATHRHHRTHTTHATQTTTTTTANRSGETALTGATLDSASASALKAVPGGTVTGATTENDATGAYEVHITKADGTHVKVIEDASFAVLSVTSGGGCR